MEAPQFASPLPWSIIEKPHQIIDAKGGVVARLTVLDIKNAELIVTAVNATFTTKQP